MCVFTTTAQHNSIDLPMQGDTKGRYGHSLEIVGLATIVLSMKTVANAGSSILKLSALILFVVWGTNMSLYHAWVVGVV